MEKYVVSRELAEKLKAAGYPQNTQFGWDFDMDDNGNNDGYYVTEQVGNEKVGYLTAAPLSDELQDALTEVMTGLTLYHNHGYMQWEAFYAGKFFEYGADGTHFDSMADKPADALAKLWLWCKEHGYLEGGR